MTLSSFIPMLNVSQRLPAQNISVELNTFQLLLFLIKNRCHNSFDTLIWLVPCLIYNYLEECLRQATEMGSLCKLQYESNFKWHFGNPSKDFFGILLHFPSTRKSSGSQHRDNAMPWIETMGWVPWWARAGNSTHPPVLAGVTCVCEENLSFIRGWSFCVGVVEVRLWEIKRKGETFLNLSSCPTPLSYQLDSSWVRALPSFAFLVCLKICSI